MWYWGLNTEQLSIITKGTFINDVTSKKKKGVRKMEIWDSMHPWVKGWGKWIEEKIGRHHLWMPPNWVGVSHKIESGNYQIALLLIFFNDFCSKNRISKQHFWRKKSNKWHAIFVVIDLKCNMRMLCCSSDKKVISRKR